VSDLEFGYVTYIRTAPETVWRALTDAEITRTYWFDVRVESDWQVGSPVRLVGPDGKLWDHGEVLECEPLRRLSYTWITVMPELVGEPASRLTIELEPVGPEVRLALTHDGFEPGSKLYESVREGWPALLSSLKSLLETGEPLAIVTTMMAS
jgi:uncharacterized protein YndB with AHSA1/START domain